MILVNIHLTELLSDVVLLSRHDVLHLPESQDVPPGHQQAGRQRQHHWEQLGHDQSPAVTCELVECQAATELLNDQSL